MKMMLVATLTMTVFTVGCLGASVSNMRATEMTSMAVFDTDCSSMQLVGRVENSRFKFKGCGKIALYACSTPSGYGGFETTDSLVQTMVQGNENCKLVSVTDDPNAATEGTQEPQ